MEARSGGTVDPPDSASSASVVVVVVAVAAAEEEEVEEVEWARASADRRWSWRKTASAASGFRWYLNAYIVLVYISSNS